MMEKKNILNIKNILRDFSGLAEARRNHTFRTKLVFIFSAVTIAMVLLFAYRVVNGAMNKILVVNEGGEFVHFKAVRQDMLYPGFVIASVFSDLIVVNYVQQRPWSITLMVIFSFLLKLAMLATVKATVNKWL